MASSTLIWFPIVLYIDLEGESFWYQCYICQFSCVYMVYQNMWGGGGVEKLYSFSAKSSNFFSMKGLFLWNFFQSSDSSDSITYFWICLLSSLHVLCSECPYFVIKSVWMSCLPTDFPPSKGYESDSTLFSIVSNSFHPSPHFGIVVKVTVFTF